MSERFEALVRSTAGAPTRRGVLKALVGAGAAATAAAVLKPFRAEAACPAGAAACGENCCQQGEICSDKAFGCCCPSGATPCGRTCCKSGVACASAADAICGCPSGTTPCGTGKNLRCCPAGVACTRNNTCPLASSMQSETTAKRCCFDASGSRPCGCSQPGVQCGGGPQCQSDLDCCNGVCIDFGGGVFRCGCGGPGVVCRSDAACCSGTCARPVSPTGRCTTCP